jgi:hypothetical protein
MVNLYEVKAEFYGKHFQYVHTHADTATDASEPLILYAFSVQDAHVPLVYTCRARLCLPDTSLALKH